MKLQSFYEYEKMVGNTAVYPDANGRTVQALSYCALGLAGESGEYAEKIKKLIRDGTFHSELVAKELGDVLWYLTRSANELGYTLQQIAEMNIVKLSDRKDRGVLKGSGDER